MKKYLLSLIAMIIAMASFAQTSLVATLTHGEDIKMFYGSFAFREAHNAAENGDIINLSDGAFQSVNITKAVTVRGAAGMDSEKMTYITGDFDINIPVEVSQRLSFEGCRITHTVTVYGTLTNAYFLKSHIEKFHIRNNDQKMVNGMFVNCAIFEVDLFGKSTMQFLNSHVANFYNYASQSAGAAFVNCVIQPRGDGEVASAISSSMLENCILFGTVTDHNSYSLPSSTIATNCVAVGRGVRNAFYDVVAKQNCSYAGMDIFKDSNVWNDLTDEAKALYIGTDGTPVGKFGGVLPYDPTPSYPQITKMNVANKTTADGKLSVEIEVSATK